MIHLHWVISLENYCNLLAMRQNIFGSLIVNRINKSYPKGITQFHWHHQLRLVNSPVHYAITCWMRRNPESYHEWISWFGSTCWLILITGFFLQWDKIHSLPWLILVSTNNMRNDSAHVVCSRTSPLWQFGKERINPESYHKWISWFGSTCQLAQ